MVDVVSQDDLRTLAAVGSPHCVSCYLPTHRSGPEVAQDPIRLKNLLTAAARELEAGGMRPGDVADLLGEARAMVDDAEFWAQSTDGLAVFVTADDLQWFRLPGPVAEAFAVSDRLWVAPLIPFVTADAAFFVLALSDNQVRLLRAQQHEVTELELGAIPVSKEDALPFDDRESQLHSHGADRVGSGTVSAAFHGQGVANDFDDVDRTRFFQAIDHGLADAIGDPSAPLVLAGVEAAVSHFRRLSSHPNVVESFVAGNPERHSPRELHEQALPLVSDHFDGARGRALESLGSPSTTTADTLADVLEAATTGRVAELIVGTGCSVWGTWDETGQTPEVHTDRRHGDHDLVDLAVRETLAHRGTVVAADVDQMPTDSPVAAVLRY